MNRDLRTLTLQHLEANPQGLLLDDLQEAVGAAGETARKQLQVLLRGLKQGRRIVTTHHATETGSVPVHRITAAGVALLEHRQLRAQLPPVEQRTTHPLFDDEPVLRTGAMQYEQPTIVRSTAKPGQLHTKVPNSVFSLGGWQR